MLRRRSCVVWWFLWPSGQGAGLQAAFGRGPTAGEGAELAYLAVRAWLQLNLEKWAGRVGVFQQVPEQLLTSAAPQQEDLMSAGVFVQREAEASLRLKTLCPELSKWDLVSWKGFLGLGPEAWKPALMMRSLPKDSVFVGPWTSEGSSRSPSRSEVSCDWNEPAADSASPRYGCNRWLLLKSTIFRGPGEAF